MSKRSSTKRDEPDPTFLADQNLGSEFVRLLREAGFSVEDHRDHFPHKEDDDSLWIAETVNRDWIILSYDKSIARNLLEINALMAGGGRAYIQAERMKPADFAHLIIRTQARLFRHIKKMRKYTNDPYMAKIFLDKKDPKKPGSVRTWIDLPTWRSKVASKMGP